MFAIVVTLILLEGIGLVAAIILAFAAGAVVFYGGVKVGARLRGFEGDLLEEEKPTKFNQVDSA